MVRKDASTPTTMKTSYVRPSALEEFIVTFRKLKVSNLREKAAPDKGG
jgi:hypothetical protein